MRERTETPFDGLPGFWNRVNRALFRYAGPAQLGRAGETPFQPAADPRCPVCRQPMAEHRIMRTADSTTPTRIHCPAPAGPIPQ